MLGRTRRNWRMRRLLTPSPGDGIQRVAGGGADDMHLPPHHRLDVRHGVDQRRAVDVQPRRVAATAGPVSGDTGVQATILGKR